MTKQVDEGLLQAAEARLQAKRKALGIPAPGALLEKPQAPKRIASERSALRVVRPRAPLTPEESAQRRASTEERVRRDALEPRALAAWLRSAGVGKRLLSADLREALVPGPLRAWASQFPSSLEGASALLSGPPGTGKTCSAVWLLAELYRRGRLDWGDSTVRCAWRVPRARFVPASDLTAACFERQRRDPLAEFERADVLVVDDWGMPYESDWAMALLDRLIDRRWAELLPTIVTTNVVHEGTDSSFAALYPRIFSRLADSSGPGVVPVVREDLRRSR